MRPLIQDVKSVAAREYGTEIEEVGLGCYTEGSGSGQPCTRNVCARITEAQKEYDGMVKVSEKQRAAGNGRRAELWERYKQNTQVWGLSVLSRGCGVCNERDINIGKDVDMDVNVPFGCWPGRGA